MRLRATDSDRPRHERRPAWAVRFGLALVATIVLVAVAAPWVAPQDPDQQDLSRRLEGPSREHLLGLDELGRDVLSRLVYGARVSVSVGLAVVKT